MRKLEVGSFPTLSPHSHSPFPPPPSPFALKKKASLSYLDVEHPLLFLVLCTEFPRESSALEGWEREEKEGEGAVWRWGAVRIEALVYQDTQGCLHPWKWRYFGNMLLRSLFSGCIFPLRRLTFAKADGCCPCHRSKDDQCPHFDIDMYRTGKRLISVVHLLMASLSSFGTTTRETFLSTTSTCFVPLSSILEKERERECSIPSMEFSRTLLVPEQPYHTKRNIRTSKSNFIGLNLSLSSRSCAGFQKSGRAILRWSTQLVLLSSLYANHRETPGPDACKQSAPSG